MFAHVSQSASECCSERGRRMPSRLAVGLKRGLSTEFDVKLMWNSVIIKKKWLKCKIQCSNLTSCVCGGKTVLSTWILLLDRSIARNCIRKVQFSYRNSYLNSRFLRWTVLLAKSDSNLTAQTRAVEYFQLMYAFSGLILTKNHEMELENSRRQSRYLWNTVLVHSILGDVGPVQNHRLSFVLRNIFGHLGCLRASNRSGNTKRVSKGVSGCWENRDLLCSCIVQERRDPTENAKCNSCCWIFSAFVGVDACRIGPETRNWARKGSVIAEKTEIYWFQLKIPHW